MITRSHQAKANNYTLVYSITKGLNTLEPEISVIEYGISCTALHLDGTISSSAEVRYISPLYHKVSSIFDILHNHRVFPNHLKDVISDLLEEMTWEDDYADYPESA